MAESSAPVISFIPLRELKPGTKNMNVQVMILEQVGDSHYTKEGSVVRTFKVADKTGSINLCLFGENGQYLRPGDICRVLRGYCSLFKNSLTAYVGKGGEIKRIGEFCFPICEDPNMSEMPFPSPAFASETPQTFNNSNVPGPSHGGGSSSGQRGFSMR